MRVYSACEVLAALQLAGSERISQPGSHAKRRNAAGRTVIVPDHREIMPGTMRSILRQTDPTPDEFEKHA